MKKLIAKLALKCVGGVEGLIETIGGIDEIVQIALDWFNEKVLAKITDKEEFAAYAEDVAQFGFFLDGVFTRHQKWMSEAKRAALVATINAVNELAAALKDCRLEKSEIDALIDKIVAAIKAWKEIK